MFWTRSGPKSFQPKKNRTQTLKKSIGTRRVLIPFLWGGGYLSKSFWTRSGPKSFPPRKIRTQTLKKSIRAIRLLTSLLLGWALGQVVLKPVRLKNVSAQTLQEMIAFKIHKCHRVPDIYLIGVAAGPGCSETSQAQKCFSPNASEDDSYQNL